MSRKRSRETKNVNVQTPKKKSIIKTKKKRNILIPIMLIGIFFLVLFFNSYFNYSSGTAFNPEGDTIGTRFLLSGPDPYYNMRSCVETMDSGYYRFVTEEDTLLNYPIGHYGSARPPLFNMIAIGTTQLLGNFMPTIDALGWSMLFLPAIYGALLIFPVYGIGKELFSKKVGIVAALFVPLIPIHLGAGHGSAFSLFDHDSFVLLLFTVVFLLIIKSLKEQNHKKSMMYAVLAGVGIGAIEMTWIASQVVYIMIAVYLVVQIFFDIFKGKYNVKNSMTVVVALGVAFLIAIPYAMIKQNPFNYLFFTSAFCLGLLIIHYILKKANVPWILGLPSLIGLSIGGLGILWYINNFIGRAAGPLYSISSVIFGEGIYGSQVSLTIGEAHTFGISQTVMSFGPALYWIGLCGFILFIFKTHKEKWKAQNLFIIIIFLMYFWLTTTAGRFLNDLIPMMCIFTAYMMWIVLDKIDYRQMIRNIKSIGGLKGIYKGTKFIHIGGICFVGFLLLLPNTYLALDAATPPELDEEVFGEGFSGYFGNYLGYQTYWADACNWLSHQDTAIEKAEDRPGVISWWDYGFYIASMAEHPTVADNFQEGLKCAGNFHTAASEREATAVLVIRLAESQKTPKRVAVGTLTEETKELFRKHLQPYNDTGTTGIIDNETGYYNNESIQSPTVTIYPAEDLIDILEDPIKNAPTYDTFVAPEYGNTLVKVDDINAMYHDSTKIITDNLDDKQITTLYHEMTNITGKEIRYYALDGRDLVDIFGVFPFLSDKGTHGFVTLEDDYFVTYYVDRNTGIRYTDEQLNNLTRTERDRMNIGTTSERKPGYFETFIYRSYYGISENNTITANRIPTYFLRHWKPVYISPAVTITKFYEGAEIVGKVTFNSTQYNQTTAVVFDEYNVAHDINYVWPDGSFQVISPAGNITIRLYQGDTQVGNEQSIIITEEEATWKVECNKTVWLEV